jgi:iron complex outermembrane receptor protein
MKAFYRAGVRRSGRAALLSVPALLGSTMLSLPAAAQVVAPTGTGPVDQTAREQGATPAQAPGQAQSAPVAQQDPVADIVVTAQKRSENVQDVPKQVDVISSQQLASAGVTKLSEIQNISPALTGSDQSQNSRPPGIRGIVSVANSIGVQSQTGIILDDIPLPTYSTLANELTDVERVEVFAGPQSTLSGRNAAGGIINIVTRTPDFQPHVDFLAEQTTDEQTRFSVNANMPLTDTLAFNASGFINHWGGNYRNSLYPGERFGGYKTEGVRGKLRWDASDRLRVLLTGYYLATDGTNPPFLAGGPYVAVSSSAAYITLDPAKTPLSAYGYATGADNHTFTSAQTPTANTRDQGGSLRLDYDVGSVGTISSITSYSKSSQPRADVFFGYPNNPATYFAYTDVATKYTTEEIRLASPGRGPVTYLVGAIYTDTQIDQPYIRRTIFPVNWLRYSSQKSYAAFGRVTWQFTQRDFLTGGLRYQYDDQGYRWVFRDVTTDATTGTSRGNSHYDFFAGEASLRHEFTPNVSVYFTYSNSQTGQAYDLENNAAAAVGTLQPLDSEKVQNYEAGFKTRLFDRRLTFNVNGFWADYDNYQVQSINSNDTTQAPVIRLLAIGKVRTRGAELQASLRAAEGLTLGFAGAYTESVIRDYPNAGCYLLQTAAQGCVNGVQANLAGQTLPIAPRWKYNATADYRRPLVSDVDLTAGLFYRYQSSVNYDILGDPKVRQAGYGVLNLRLGVASPRGSRKTWSLEAFVNNVLDKNYYSFLFDRSNRFSYPAGVDTTVLAARYDRSSFRYAGVRATLGL